MTYKIACFVWSELEFRGTAFVDFGVEIEVAKTQAMGYVRALNDEDDGLTFLHGDFSRLSCSRTPGWPASICRPPCTM